MMREDEDAAPDNKKKRDGEAGDAVPRRRKHLESSSEAAGEHVGNSSVFVQCFLPEAFRESIMFCFVLFCMLKECSAVSVFGCCVGAVCYSIVCFIVSG